MAEGFLFSRKVFRHPRDVRAPRGKFKTLPAKSAAVPAKSAGLAAKFRTAPAKFKAFPVKSGTVPAKSGTPPAKSDALPAKFGTVPAKSKPQSKSSQLIVLKSFAQKTTINPGTPKPPKQ
jgi:hypothetical protein